MADLRSVATWQYAREPAGPLEGLVARCSNRLPEPVIIIDAAPDPADPIVLWVNTSFCRMTGYTESEIVGRAISIFQGPRTEDAAIRRRTACLGEGASWVGETWSYGKNGQPFRLHATMVPVRGEESDPPKWFVAVARDVTRQRQADRELARRTRELETITTHSPDVILRLDEHGRFTYANDVAADVLGLRPGAMQLRTLEELARPGSDRDRLTAEIRAVIRDPERRTIIVRSPFPRSDRILEVRMVPEFGGQGMVEHVVCFVRDVSDRIRAEEGLRESEERRMRAVEARLHERELEFRDLAESVPVYIWMTDDSGRSVFANEAWTQFTCAADSVVASAESPPDAADAADADAADAADEHDPLPIIETIPIRPALAVDWRGRIHPQDRLAFDRDFERALADQRSFEIICRIQRADGEYRSLVVNGMPRFDDGRFLGVLGTGVDITDQQRREEMQRVAVAELEHASRLTMAGQMAAAMVHEMSQPLSAVAMFIEIAQRHLLAVDGVTEASGAAGAADAASIDGSTSINRAVPSSDREAVERAVATLHDAQASALRAGDLSRRMLQFVRRKDPRPDRVDLGETIRKSMKLMRSDATDHNVRLEYGGDLDGVWIVADATEIEQVICNLTRNACEAIAAHGQTSGAVHFSGTVDGRRAQLTVRDNGPGVSDAVRDTIFEPFHTKKESGIGLGLWICWNILERYRGTIRVADTGPDGTAFEIGLELATETVGNGRRGDDGSEFIGADAGISASGLRAADAGAAGAVAATDAARRVQEELAAPGAAADPGGRAERDVPR